MAENPRNRPSCCAALRRSGSMANDLHAGGYRTDRLSMAESQQIDLGGWTHEL
jgi:hypothetical protein